MEVTHLSSESLRHLPDVSLGRGILYSPLPEWSDKQHWRGLMLFRVGSHLTTNEYCLCHPWSGYKVYDLQNALQYLSYLDCTSQNCGFICQDKWGLGHITTLQIPFQVTLHSDLEMYCWFTLLLSINPESHYAKYCGCAFTGWASLPSWGEWNR